MIEMPEPFHPMKTIFKAIAFLALALVCNSCSSPSNPPPTVGSLDKSRYAGEWHEIARLPNPFEKDLVAAKATYGVNPDGTISVRNEGIKSNGKRTSIQGTAKPAPSGQPGQLLVRFDKFPTNLFAGDYWILDVNPAYTRALVGSPNKKFLWLLSKKLEDTKQDFSSQLYLAEKYGLDTSKVFYNPRRIQN
jgi:apolipoprotein D and lipocalin family protein